MTTSTKRSPFKTRLARKVAELAPADERTASEEYDLALAKYDEEMALYEHERKRWNEVWRAAGKEPPPCQQIKPVPPKKPAGIECDRCDGYGMIECHECFHERTCPDCDGSGEAA